MKKIILAFLMLLAIQIKCFAHSSFPKPFEASEGFIQILKEDEEEVKDSEIEAIYKKQIPCDITFDNNLDPYEQQDNYQSSRSPYPLIRTVMPMTSIKTTIEPGYYLLTPRKIGARDYMLFKQQGKVFYIVPIYLSKQIDPEKEYPKIEDPCDKAPFGLKNAFKAVSIMTGRRTPIPKVPMHKVDCFQYNDQFYGINVYYKDRIYKTVYKIKNYE